MSANENTCPGCRETIHPIIFTKCEALTIIRCLAAMGGGDPATSISQMVNVVMEAKMLLDIHGEKIAEKFEAAAP